MPNQHLQGSIGDKIAGLICRVDAVNALPEGEFGPKTLVKFRTFDGDLLTWFASGKRTYLVGSEVRISFTIKQFKQYRNIRETQITRAKVYEGGT